MPAYRTHVKVNFLLALPLSLLFFKWLGLGKEDLLFFSGAFLYGTLFMHPDLDIAKKVSPFSLRGLLSLPFLPYSFLFRHRGISHMPVVGTATRVLWLFGVIAITCTLLGYTMPILDQPFLVPILFGFGLADLGHEVLDQIHLRRRKH